MPDPYGIMPLSLSADTTARSIYNSKSVTFGGYGKTTSYASSTQNFTASSTTGAYGLAAYNNPPFVGAALTVSSGTYFDYTANVSFSSSEYSSLVLSGGFSFYLFCLSAQNLYSYPDTAQLLVNKSPVGDVISSSGNGVFVFSDLEVVLSGEVTSVGVRFTWTSSDSLVNRTTSTSLGGATYLYMSYTDNVNITPVIDDSLDYEPFFNRVIAWEQSIYGAIGALGVTK